MNSFRVQSLLWTALVSLGLAGAALAAQPKIIEVGAIGPQVAAPEILKPQISNGHKVHRRQAPEPELEAPVAPKAPVTAPVQETALGSLAGDLLKALGVTGKAENLVNDFGQMAHSAAAALGGGSGSRALSAGGSDAASDYQAWIAGMRGREANMTDLQSLASLIQRSAREMGQELRSH